MQKKLRVGIIGTGNIGTDLLMKVIKSNFLECTMFIGRNLQSKGISNVDLTFHPWAYDYFKLDRVPAYALSYCKKDFRFKTCEHKFLAKGEISLTNFFEIVSDENLEYKKYFQKLIEAK